MTKENNKNKPSSAKASEDKIQKAIEKIRPALQADGGDVELVGWDKKTGVVQVKMLGMCSGCPMAEVTLKQGIEAEIKKAVPEVKEVIAV